MRSCHRRCGAAGRHGDTRHSFGNSPVPCRAWSLNTRTLALLNFNKGRYPVSRIWTLFLRRGSAGLQEREEGKLQENMATLMRPARHMATGSVMRSIRGCCADEEGAVDAAKPRPESSCSRSEFHVWIPLWQLKTYPHGWQSWNGPKVSKNQDVMIKQEHYINDQIKLQSCCWWLN